MKVGVLEIVFNEAVNEEDVQNILSSFYLDNEKEISGMEWKQFDSKNTLDDIHKIIEKRIKELDAKDSLAECKAKEK